MSRVRFIVVTERGWPYPDRYVAESRRHARALRDRYRRAGFSSRIERVVGEVL